MSSDVYQTRVGCGDEIIIFANILRRWNAE
jgi:hypothetical protein